MPLDPQIATLLVRRRFDGLIHGFFGLGTFCESAAKAIEHVCGDFRDLLEEASTRG